MYAHVFTTSLLFLALIVPEASACRTGVRPNPATGKAIYFITNDAVNAVVALPIGADGLLSAAGTFTATGGAGANSIDGATNQPAAPDALVSQSALTIAGSNLFAVNAGSNTVSMFAINPADPTRLSMVGQPVAVLGEFPNTVAASDKNRLVCVGSSGAKAGISCTSFSARGMAAMDGLRVIDLQQTTPPVGPTNTVSQVFFSNDENTLFSTVKGDPAQNNTGFLASFQVQAKANGLRFGAAAAAVSAQGTASSPDGTAVLFGSSTIPGSTDLFVTDASFGAAVLSVDLATGAATVKGKTALDGQKATCWAAVSLATNTAFVTDVGVNRVVEMSLADASVVATVDLSANGDPGLIDLKVAGNFLYALSPGDGTTQPAVAVLDVISKQQVQHAELQALGVGKNAQGMAVLL